MALTSYLRRLALIAALGCAILVACSSAALAREIDDPALPTVPASSSAEPGPGSLERHTDRTLPIALGGALALIAVGTAGYTFGARVSRRAIA
jgi:hypothetical protein